MPHRHSGVPSDARQAPSQAPALSPPENPSQAALGCAAWTGLQPPAPTTPPAPPAEPGRPGNVRVGPGDTRPAVHPAQAATAITGTPALRRRRPKRCWVCSGDCGGHILVRCINGETVGVCAQCAAFHDGAIRGRCFKCAAPLDDGGRCACWSAP